MPAQTNRKLAGFVAVVAATAITLTAGSARANPAGTLTLTTGLSTTQQFVNLVEADAGTVVYGASAQGPRFFGGSFQFSVTPPAASVGLPSLDSFWDSLVGSLITGASGDGFNYRTVDGVTSGSRTAPSPSAAPVTGTSDGYLFTAYVPPSNNQHLFKMKASDGAVSDLGALPSTTGVTNLFVQADANATGVVLAYNNLVKYMTFAAPGTFTGLSTASSVEFSDIRLGSNAASWVEASYQSGAKVVRTPLTGASAVTYVSPYATHAATTAATTAWTVGNFVANPPVLSFKTAPAAGGAVTTWSTAPTNPGVVVLGTKFVVAKAKASGAQALVSMTSASGSDATEIAQIPASPNTSPSVAVGPSRVAWNDDSEDGLPVWSRSLSGSGAGLTGGAKTYVSHHSSSAGQVAVSGRRTAYYDNGSTTNSVNLRLNTGSVDYLIASGVFSNGRAQLSGMRLLYQTARSTFLLKDLVTGGITALSSLNIRDYALWGNYLAYVKTDGSVWRRNLLGGSDVQVRAALPSGGVTDEAFVAVAGDYVGWAMLICNTSHVCSSSQTAYRNVTTGTAQTTLPASSSPFEQPETGIAMSPSYLLRSVDSSLKATQMGTGTTTNPLSLALGATFFGVPPFAINGSRAAWIAADGTANVGDLTHVAEPPRFLGNPLAPKFFDPAVAPWKAEFVASNAMPTCAVTLKSGATVVRTLDCDNTDGDAQVSWDGKNTGGTLLPAGNYTWTLSGINADGALKNYDGTASPITGTVHLGKVGYAAATPTRLMDTRNGTGVPAGAVPAGGTRTLTVPNVPAGATAVALSVTATGGTAGTYISVCPGGTPVATCKASSAFNPPASSSVANLVLVKLGAGNTVTFYNNTGSIHLIADLQGFEVGSAYAAQTPTRVMDTRNGTGVPAGALGAGSTRTLTLTNVPAGATAAAINVTATGGTANTYVSVCPGGTAPATCAKSSNLNPVAHTTTANMALVKLGAGNTITFYNFTGSIHLIVDLQGYEVGSAYSATAPTRVMDTRNGTGVRVGVVPAGATVTLTVPNVPAGSTAAVLNVTATGGSTGTYISVCPGGTPVATCSKSSNFNPPAHTSIAVLVFAKLGAGNKVTFYNHAGSVHLIADAQGFLKPSA